MQNNSLSLLMLASAMGSLFLALYTFTRRNHPAMFNLSLLLMAATVWALGYSLELASTNLQTMKVFTAFTYLGIATIPVFWLIFVARYTGNDGWLNPLNTALLFIIPAISIVLVATNDLHYLFYSLYEMDLSGDFSFSRTEPGLFWWIHVTYSYLAIISGLWLLISLYFKVPRPSRFLVGLFVAGLLLPYAANIAYVSGLKPYGFLDITPIAFIVMGVLLSFGAFTKRAMDVSPLAYDLLFQNIPDIIFVIDTQGRIVNTNPAAQKLLDYELKRESAGDDEPHNLLITTQTLSALTDASEIELNEKIYTVSNTPILSPGNKALGKLIFLHNITERKQAEETLRESEQRYREILETTEEGFYEADLKGKIIACNRAATNLLGYQETEIIGMSYKALFKDPDAVFREFNQTLKSGNPKFSVVIETIRKDGSIATADLSVSLTYDKQGHISGFRGMGRDITERKKAEEALAYRLSYEKLISGISAHFVNLPAEHFDERINYALEVVGKFFEVDRSYVYRFSQDGLTYSNTHLWCTDGVEGFFEKDQKFPVELTPWWINELRNGRVVIIDDVEEMPPEAAKDRADFLAEEIKSLLTLPLIWAGEVFGCFGFDLVKEKRTWAKEQIDLLQIIAELITGAFAQHDANQKIRSLSFYDQLTGLYNRRYFENELERLDRSREHPIVVISADLDGLKLINDTLGHAEGDRYLQAGAELLKNALRASDILARVGGDEFALLLPRTAQKTAEELIDRLRRQIEEHNRRQTGIPLSISIGLAVSEDSKQPLEETYKQADAAMYRDKLTRGKEARSAIIASLLTMLYGRSDLGEGTGELVQELTLQLGKGLSLGNESMADLQLLSRVYDLGKVNMPEQVTHSNLLSKTGELTEAESEAIRRHPEAGYRIASASPELAGVADLILRHHEHYDGSGYPIGLKGEEIPIECRILAIVNAYSAMLSPRAYATKMEIAEALAEIKRCAGSQFDPQVVEVFVKIIERSA